MLGELDPLAAGSTRLAVRGVVGSCDVLKPSDPTEQKRWGAQAGWDVEARGCRSEILKNLVPRQTCEGLVSRVGEPRIDSQ